MSVCMDRITHTSSIIAPSFGNKLLTSMPLCPYRLNSKGEAIRFPVLRSVFGLPIGLGFPLYLASAGFGSKESTWEIAPLRNRNATRLALGAKCGVLGARGPEAAEFAPSRLARPNMPNPPPNVVNARLRFKGNIRLLQIEEFVRGEQ